MFKTRETSAQDVFDHRGSAKVLKLDFDPEKAEKQLEPWLAAGWTVKSTSAIQLLGQTAFVLGFLERKPR